MTAFGRSPIISTDTMSDTVAELRSRPYQMAHVRSATSQNGSTVVDDDTRKSDYKRIVSNTTGSGNAQTGGTQNTVVSTPKKRISFYSFINLEMAKSSYRWSTIISST
jgi:hypothetical protein